MSTNVVLRLQFFFSFSPQKAPFSLRDQRYGWFGTNCAETPSTKKRRRKRHKHTYLRNYVCIAKLNLYRRESCLGEKRDATVRFVFSCSEYVIRARANVNPIFFFPPFFSSFGDHKDSSFCGKRRDRGETTSRPLVVFVVREWKEQLPLGVVVVREDALAHLFPSVLVSVPDHYYTPLVPIQNQQIKSLY